MKTDSYDETYPRPMTLKRLARSREITSALKAAGTRPVFNEDEEKKPVSIWRR